MEPDNKTTAGLIQAKRDLVMLLTVVLIQAKPGLVMLLTVIDASMIVGMKVVAQSQVLWMMV
jgi:hypothetical protein